jgi:hypothetical protein
MLNNEKSLYSRVLAVEVRVSGHLTGRVVYWLDVATNTDNRDKVCATSAGRLARVLDVAFARSVAD